MQPLQPDLTVRGTKIKLNRTSSLRLPTTNYYHNQSKSERRRCNHEGGTKDANHPQRPRMVYQVNVNNYTNQQAYGATLRKIYEAIEYDDFKRFLKVFDCPPGARPKTTTTTTRRRVAPVLCSAAVRECYRANFEVHYDVLKRIVQGHRCEDPV